MDLSRTKHHLMLQNRSYLTNVITIHESLPLPFSCKRTVVRINIPGYDL